jgi:hypothetical protein
MGKFPRRTVIRNFETIIETKWLSQTKNLLVNREKGFMVHH